MRCVNLCGCTLAVTIVLVAGCGRLSTEYGTSSGRLGRTSLNGFGALRKSFEQAGVKCRDASRLTHRTMNNEIVVWTPRLTGPIDSETAGWFERWLAGGGKSLVYIIPDCGSEAEYWADATQLAPSQQRLSYRKQSARVLNEQMAVRLKREPIRECDWFDVEPFPARHSAGTLNGDWAEFIQPSNDSPSPLSTELTIVASTSPEAGTDTTPLAGSATTGPASPADPPTDDESASEVEVSLESMLESESGRTIVAKITADQWSDSQILVIAGGSLLTNYAFTDQQNRQLAEQLITASIDPSQAEPTAAFISSRWSELPVSDGKPKLPGATGMELLTVWPISLVTMHGVLLALVVALGVLPIFGRPRRLRVSQQRDFGDHLDAVAALMNKTGDVDFAREKVREYRKRIHGDLSSDTQDELDTTSPPAQSARNEEKS